jgi:hypothetical protein
MGHLRTVPGRDRGRVVAAGDQGPGACRVCETAVQLSDFVRTLLLPAAMGTAPVWAPMSPSRGSAAVRTFDCWTVTTNLPRGKAALQPFARLGSLMGGISNRGSCLRLPSDTRLLFPGGVDGTWTAAHHTL